MLCLAQSNHLYYHKNPSSVDPGQPVKISQTLFNEEYIKIIGKGNKQRIVPVSRSIQDLVGLYKNSLNKSHSVWFLTTDNYDKLYEKFVSYHWRSRKW